MLITYTGRSSAGRWIDVDGVDVHIPHGTPIELPDPIAEQLVATGDYKAAKPAKTKTPEGEE